MSTHITFMDDAVESFLEAFVSFEAQADLDEAGRSLQVAKGCVRSLYIAVEKGLKASLAAIDPYLVLTKVNGEVVKGFRKDLLSRSAASIFVSRVPHETVSAVTAWELVRDLRGMSASPAAQAFEVSFRRLADARHRLQHGEIETTTSELIGLAEEVFSRFLGIHEGVPGWLERLVLRNDQIVARLRGIEQRVDRAWLVLVDILSKGATQLRPAGYLIHPVDSQTMTFLFTEDAAGSSLQISALADVPASNASGFCSKYLPREAVDARAVQRRPASDAPVRAGATLAMFAGAVDGRGGSLSGSGDSRERQSIAPLQPGAFAFDSVPMWIARSGSAATSSLSVSALGNVRVRFPDGDSGNGFFEAELRPARALDGGGAQIVRLTGRAVLDDEFNATTGEGENRRLATAWSLRFELSAEV